MCWMTKHRQEGGAFHPPVFTGMTGALTILYIISVIKMINVLKNILTNIK